MACFWWTEILNVNYAQFINYLCFVIFVSFSKSFLNPSSWKYSPMFLLEALLFTFTYRSTIKLIIYVWCEVKGNLHFFPYGYTISITLFFKKIVLLTLCFIAHQVTVYIGIFLDYIVYFVDLFIYPQANIILSKSLQLYSKSWNLLMQALQLLCLSWLN